MNAENRQHHGPQRESQTEMQLSSLQRAIRIVPSGSYLVTHPYIEGTQTIDVGILPEGQTLVASNKFAVKNPPTFHYDKNGNRASDAQYFIDEHETPDGHVIYLSKLDPNSVTSKHRHPHPMREFYILLHGEAFQGEEPMQPQSVINPFEYHQVTTREQPALLLIFMENGAKVPKHLRHQP